MDVQVQRDARIVTFSVTLAPADAVVAPGGTLTIPYPSGLAAANLQVGTGKLYVGGSNAYALTAAAGTAGTVQVALGANIVLTNNTGVPWDSSSGKVPLTFTLPLVIVTLAERVAALENKPVTPGVDITKVRSVYISSVDIVASNGTFNFAGIVPAGATEVEIECVGAGSSGFSGRFDTTNNIYFPGHGGYPGGVTRRRMRVADVPNTLAVTIGAGGAQILVQQALSRTNAGGATIFGNLLQAGGGPGVSQTLLADLPNPGIMAASSDIPLGQPGVSSILVNLLGTVAPPGGYGNTATPSDGPSGGGAGCSSNANANYGTGGTAGCARPDTIVAGGVQNPAPYGGGPGANAPNVFGYGSGGCGAVFFNGGGPTYPFQAGAGGAPGGGGGGGPGFGGANGIQSNVSYAGAGGRGGIRLHFRGYEVAA